MTVTADGIVFRMFNHGYLRKRVLGWSDIRCFSADRTIAVDHGTNMVWVPVLIPINGRERGLRAIPRVLFHEKQQAEFACDLLNRSLNLTP
jgi:hypothetical protein